MPDEDIGRGLIIVDVQNDFADPQGSLYVPHGEQVAEDICDFMLELEDIYRQVPGHPLYSVVLLTKDWHPDSDDFPHFSAEPDFNNTWPPHCRQDTWGAQYHPALFAGGDEESSPWVYDYEFYKGVSGSAYSGFEGYNSLGTSLKKFLVESNITHIDVCGLATDYCVKATALDGIALGFHVRLIKQFCAAVHGDGAESIAQMHKEGVEILEGFPFD